MLHEAPAADASAHLPEPLRPIRGLVVAFREPDASAPYSLTALKKWLKLSADVFKVEKVDVLMRPGDLPLLDELLAYGNTVGLRLSLRITPEGAPPNFGTFASTGLLDLHFAAPIHHAPEALREWLAAGTAAGLPVRVTLVGPPRATQQLEHVADAMAGAGAVSVALHDPFLDWSRWQKAREPRQAVERMNRLVELLAERGVDGALLFVPFCHVERKNFARNVNLQQYWLDHQHYDTLAYQTARQIQGHSSSTCDKLLENYLTRQTSVHNLIDDRLLPWIINYPWFYIRIWAFHKLTRHLRLARHRPKALPETVEAAEAAVVELREKQRATMPPECARCSLQRLCDHPTEAFKHILPELDIHALPGETLVDPLHFRRTISRTYDALDQVRLEEGSHGEAAAELAASLLQEKPTREVTIDDYAIDGHMSFPMPGSMRWYSFANAELQSTVLARLQPPFAISYTLGGGYAELAGFGFGRHTKILCPMIGPSHRLALHVDTEGRYHFFRDGELVRPLHFSGVSYVPRKLGGVLEPRISIWNVDGQVVTQNVLVWEPEADGQQTLDQIVYSVIIISTLYSRRLQAVLNALAHQVDADWAGIEIIIGYVPGIDATDDLIDSMHLTHPHLRIVRAPFGRPYTKSKGFMINECSAMASGSWIVLMDSDIVAPPNLFAELDRAKEGTYFLAPEGRKMLSPAVTAQILLGEVQPWEDYGALLETAGEYRHRESDGVPPGFLQCVRRDVFDETRYAEFNHFEGADYYFGLHIIREHGPERRLEGMKVLHLDHGGSQWYGASKQM